jgi:NAD(P)H-hydrate repair Nnr-like enzyme with NAD(P)H-hydrate dehydratase domain
MLMLNILSQNRSSLLPSKSILTPHPKELERLIGKWIQRKKIRKNDRLSPQHLYDCRYEGAPTHIINAEKVYRNTTGNAAFGQPGRCFNWNN